MSALTIVILTLIASAFASGTEIAFLSANKLRIELDRKQGSFPARIIWNFVKSPSRFIAMLLILNNVAIVVYGIYMSDEIFSHDRLSAYLPRHFHSEAEILIIQTFLSTLIILVTAEFIPKVIFRIDPNRALTVLALPIQFIYFLLWPIVFVIMALSRFILKNIVGVELAEDRPVFGRVDLDFYIRDLTTKNPQREEMDTEMDIFQNALDFTEVKVRECMVPRKEIVAINVDEPIDKLRKLFIETKHSRILVYRESPGENIGESGRTGINNIIGFVHSSEMFSRPKDISSVLLPITIVPEVMHAHELLQQFIDLHRTIAVVVDEFGGTAGVVTIEDVMEEIFGEIRDEHDTDEIVEKKINDSEYLFSGRLEIDSLNKRYDLRIPENEAYETLGGFIIHHHENIPQPKEEVIIPPFTITILQLKDNRIEQVRLKVNKEI